MNELLKKACGKINYDTYVKLETGTLFSVTSLNLLNIFILDNLPVSTPIDFVSATMYSAYIYSVLSRGARYTKDVSEIRCLYQEFIRNYNELNKIFNFNEPISVYTMFNYLVYNGYLSVGKNFEFNAKTTYNERALSMGVGVTIGSGCCRHISSMMVDILNDMGIMAYNLSCFSVPIKTDMELIDEDKYSREDNIKFINKYILDVDKRMSLIKKIIDLENIGIYVKLVASFEEISDKCIKDRKHVNHAITMALCDGKSYFLDPTQKRVYRLKDGSKSILYDDISDKIYSKIHDTWVSNYDKPIREVKRNCREIIKYPSISLEEEKAIVSSSLELCKGNMDLFDKFYDDNNELYNEINNKLVKFRKK